MTIPESLQGFATQKLFHKTWAGTYHCRPQAVFQPRTMAEIKELIHQARRHGKTIMTVGLGHSPSDLTMTKEWLCNLDHFNAVVDRQEFSAGGEVKFVDLTAEAGCRVFELNQYLKDNQLAIQNLGSISDQSLAGLISTGTHGSTQYHGLVAQQVVSITFLDSQAREITCSSVDKPEVFRAVLLSLGKIGIITHVTLRTCPSYTIKSKQEIISFDTLTKNWDNIWLDSEFIRIWWFPYTNRCVCWRASKSDEPLSAPRPSWYGTAFGRFFYESLLWISVKVWPGLTPYIERFVFNQQYGNVETLGKGDIAVQHSVDGLNMDCLFSQFVNEWSAPLVNGVQILHELRDHIETAAANGDFYVHAPIEVRCSNATNSDTAFISDETGEPSLYPPTSWLEKRNRLSAGPIPGNNFRAYLDNSPVLPYAGEGAPVTNDQLTLFINATMYRPFHTNVPTHQWYQNFEDVMSRAGGKPHWAKNFIGVDGDHRTPESLDAQLEFGGKQFYSMLGFNPVMKKWFGENLVKYNKVRKETDPEGVFLSGKAWAERNGILLD
ncbi:D-arabinono-1,4-lactone oxidase [Suhomyces tanzawaensis NRRL Y-17324]|uniref:D-arabinono-1,4-lactone oxidase n=1 Tax=Suhomyces tanzawaensis NRRL Y-17324 TaxID=984487 RepID=A0A1E4SNN4_9ASCO|nr:D-arabinono-1,4-lactone oxidase [Suhomyces tanzawaensis NRRL Y-17324]ODV81123.1 D-arabinono-1,4-lactone oxidase [Suhomyces tanzawaensis NRRL Y-17324]